MPTPAGDIWATWGAKLQAINKSKHIRSRPQPSHNLEATGKRTCKSNMETRVMKGSIGICREMEKKMEATM